MISEPRFDTYEETRNKLLALGADVADADRLAAATEDMAAYLTRRFAGRRVKDTPPAEISAALDEWYRLRRSEGRL